MWRKGWHDPNTDVFTFKLSKDVELELHTPKCEDLNPKLLNTVAVQVLEEEFDDFKKTGGAADKDAKDKKGKAKGKKGGKGKKK